MAVEVAEGVVLAAAAAAGLDGVLKGRTLNVVGARGSSSFAALAWTDLSVPCETPT